jgi:hypothetical protein
MGERDYSLSIVGESFRNPDGSNRQTEIRKCKPGELVLLRRDPGNKHDKMATAVISAGGVQIGFLSSGHAQWIGNKIDRGCQVQAIIERIGGSLADAAALAVVIRLNCDGEEPSLPNRGWLSRLFGR